MNLNHFRYGLILLFITVSCAVFGQSELAKQMEVAEEYVNEGDYFRALFAYDEAIHLLEKVPVSDLKTHYTTRLLYIKVLNEIINNISGFEERRFFFEREFVAYEKTIDLAYQLYAATNELKYLQQAFELAERNRNVLLLQTLKGVESLVEIPEELGQKEGELLGEVKNLEDSLRFYKRNLNQEKKNIDRLELKRDQKQQNLAQFKAGLFEKYPRYEQITQKEQKVDIRELQSQLTEEQVFIEYFYGDSTVYVFVVNSSSFFFKKLEKADIIQGMISTFLKKIHRDEKQFIRASYSLYQQLIEPIEGFLKNKKQLIVVNDGALSYLPFDALIKEFPKDWDYNFKTLKYLIYSYRLTYFKSAAAFLDKKQQSSRVTENSITAIAPLFSTDIKQAFSKIKTDSIYQQLNSLEASADLLDFIKKKYQTRELIGNEATADGFKTFADASVIHLATHTLVNKNAPLYSKIAFAKADTSDTGYLILKDLFGMSLNAEMVVLGSCETGNGTFRKGEGVVSLAYGFEMAGAKSTVYSLWSVDERATMDLMQHFYKNLHQGMAKDVALHEAKLHLLSQADEIGASPFYWASFVMNGNTEPLQLVKKQGISSMGWLIGFLGLFVLVLFYTKNTI
jgi:CHAT domain-containing protein